MIAKPKTKAKPEKARKAGSKKSAEGLNVLELAKQFELTTLQAMFALEYVANRFNATQAVLDAGYKANPKAARVQGTYNLAHPNIRKAINHLLESRVTPKIEVLARLSDMARSVDLTEYAEVVEVFGEDSDGNPFPKGFTLKFDLDAMRRDGFGHLVRKVKATSAGVEIELHDQKAALNLLGDYYKLFIQKHELSGPDGGPIPIDQDEWKKTRQERLTEALGLLQSRASEADDETEGAE